MKYSYHISKQFGDSWVKIWPYSGCGDYCQSEKKAMEQYENMLQSDMDGIFRLEKYKGITRGFFCKVIVGIVGVPIIICSNASSQD
jgi:hypothetical protein